MIKKINKMLRNKKGFTLVELIVVIAVLGILAGIAVPKYSGMRAKAHQVADEQAIVAMNKAIQLYGIEKTNSDGDEVYPSDSATLKEALKLAYDDIPDVGVNGKAFFYHISDHEMKLLDATTTEGTTYIKVPTDFLD
ncbi:type II secretion system protein [Clostridiaceae bacterium 35-E11]